MRSNRPPGASRSTPRASHVLQVDDTGIKVLDKDSAAGALRGHLWAMLGEIERLL
jgi:hypothetical protein